MMEDFTIRSEFDGIVSRLQMLGYVTTVNFEYAKDRFGNPYGWELDRYATPEKHFGMDFKNRIYHYQREPQESGNRIFEYLRCLLPEAAEKQIRKIIG